MQLYVFNLTEELFLSFKGTNSHQNKKTCINCNLYLNTFKKGEVRGFNLRIIKEYFQPKTGRKIRMFSLSWKDSIQILNSFLKLL